jgi:hypothetical protein
LRARAGIQYSPVVVFHRQGAQPPHGPSRKRAADRGILHARGLLDSGSRAEGALGRNDASGNLHIRCGLWPWKTSEARDLRIRFSHSDKCPANGLRAPSRTSDIGREGITVRCRTGGKRNEIPRAVLVVVHLLAFEHLDARSIACCCYDPSVRRHPNIERSSSGSVTMQFKACAGIVSAIEIAPAANKLRYIHLTPNRVALTYAYRHMRCPVLAAALPGSNQN